MKYKNFFEQIPLFEFLFLVISNRVSGVQFPCDVLVDDIQQCSAESINNVVTPQIRPSKGYILVDYSYGRSCLTSISKYKFDEISNDKILINLQFHRSAVSLEVRYSLKAKNTGMWNSNIEADIAKWTMFSKDPNFMATKKMVRIFRYFELEYRDSNTKI